MSIERINVAQNWLRGWAEVRERMNDSPRRRGRPLDTAALHEAIAVMEQYRGVLNRIDVALTVLDGFPDTPLRAGFITFITSIRDGFPIRSEQLRMALDVPTEPPPRREEFPRNFLEEHANGAHVRSIDACPDCMARTPGARRGSGWGTS